jgi:hypothetical protein
MMSMRRVLLGSVLASAIVLAGCQSSDTTGPSSGNTLDLSALIAEMGIGSGNVSGSVGVVGIGVPSTSPIVPSSCQYSASTHGFTCATVTSNGLTFNATYFLLDAGGHFQSQPDASTTDAIRTVADVSGTIKLDQGGNAGSMTLASHQDQTLSGLLSGTHVLNGTTTTHSDITLTAPYATHAVSDSKSVSVNITLPKAGASSHWPTSGTMTTDATSTTQFDSQSVTGTTHSVLTFNGTNTATVTTTITSGSTSITINCKIDLAGPSVPVCT